MYWIHFVHPNTVKVIQFCRDTEQNLKSVFLKNNLFWFWKDKCNLFWLFRSILKNVLWTKYVIVSNGTNMLSLPHLDLVTDKRFVYITSTKSWELQPSFPYVSELKDALTILEMSSIYVPEFENSWLCSMKSFWSWHLIWWWELSSIFKRCLYCHIVFI